MLDPRDPYITHTFTPAHLIPLPTAASPHLTHIPVATPMLLPNQDTLTHIHTHPDLPSHISRHYSYLFPWHHIIFVILAYHIAYPKPTPTRIHTHRLNTCVTSAFDVPVVWRWASHCVHGLGCALGRVLHHNPKVPSSPTLMFISVQL